MASRNPKQGQYLAQPSSSETDTSPVQLLGDGRRKRRRRDANIYDAVAGRVTTTLPLDDGSGSETHQQRRERTRLRDPTLAPEEVLFRRVGAPIRFAEKDIYHAHEQLPNGGRDILPDSDMLKAIHQYSSHFYARQPGIGNNIDLRSMDETALLAIGILLEEAGREALGKRGDLVFTEGVEMDAEDQLAQKDTGAVAFLDVIKRSKPQAAAKGDRH